MLDKTAGLTPDAKRQRAFTNKRRSEMRRIVREQDQCPQASNADIDRQIEHRFGDLARWKADDLGRALRLTFEMRDRLKVRTIRCVDMTPEQVTEYYEALRRPDVLKRRREERSKKKEAASRASRVETLSRGALPSFATSN